MPTFDDFPKIEGLPEGINLRLLELDLKAPEDSELAARLADEISRRTVQEPHLVSRKPSQILARMEGAHTLLVMARGQEGRPELVSTCSGLPMLNEWIFSEMQGIANELAEMRNYQAGIRMNQLTNNGMPLTQAAIKVGGIGVPQKDLTNTRNFVNGVAELATGYTAEEYRGKGLIGYLFKELIRRTADKPVVFGIFDPENDAVVKPLLRAGLTIFGPERLRLIPFAATFFNLCPYDDNGVGIKDENGDLPSFLRDYIEIDTDLQERYSFGKVRAVSGDEGKLLAFNLALQQDFGTVENLLQVLLMLRKRVYSPREATVVKRMDGGKGMLPIIMSNSVSTQNGSTLNAFASTGA